LPYTPGIYEFEYHNNNAEHCRPTLPERMAELGYQTLHVGKLGVRVKTVKAGWAQKHQIYQTDIDSKLLAREGLCAWGKDWIHQIRGISLAAAILRASSTCLPVAARQALSAPAMLSSRHHSSATSARRSGSVSCDHSAPRCRTRALNSGVIGTGGGGAMDAFGAARLEPSCS